MLSTQRFIVASFALITGIGFGFLLAQIISIPPPTYFEESPAQHIVVERDLKKALFPLLALRFGTSTSSYSAHQLLYVYPGFVEQDFDGVETVGGVYTFNDGLLWHIGSSATPDSEKIIDSGFVTLEKNVSARLALPKDAKIESLQGILEAPEGTSPSTVPPEVMSDGDVPVEHSDGPTMCPMDVKTCSDGSFVSRVTPGCAFAACPDEQKDVFACSPEQRNAEACIEIYAPVCASMQVQCVTTPCEPIPTQYPNSCFACANSNVTSYAEGECVAPMAE
jgi:hypothetical protein